MHFLGGADGFVIDDFLEDGFQKVVALLFVLRLLVDREDVIDAGDKLLSVCDG